MGNIKKSFTFAGQRHYVRADSDAEADKKIAELRKKLEKGEIPSQRTKRGITAASTVNDLAALYLKTYIQPKIREAGCQKSKGSITNKSYNMYKSQLDMHILPAIGKMKICDVKKSHLQNILNEQKKNGISYSTSAKTRLVLNAMFNQAIDEDIISNSPARRLEILCEKGDRQRSLTKFEKDILLKASYNPKCKNGLYFRFLLFSGIRPGESAPLQARDFNFAKNEIAIYKTIEAGTENVIAPPKTKNGERIIPIPTRCYDDLKKLCQDKKPDEFIFTQKDGKGMLSSTSIKCMWKAFYKLMDITAGAETTKRGHIYNESDVDAAGNPLYPDKDGNPKNGHAIAQDLILYDLRHTYGTDLANSGATPEEIRALMGHADISTASRYYIDSKQINIRNATKKFDEYNEKEYSIHEI